jgi:hypothetical protein
MEFIKRLFTRSHSLRAMAQPLSFHKLVEVFDVFYICFDEPNRDNNWLQIKSLIPKAQKVEGVVGFDRALKTCAGLSRTSHFFVIDGDNQLVVNRFRNPIVIKDIQDDWVLSWSSYNPLNGLAYGNGGVKLWPKEVALAMESHESASNESDPTDYCFVVDYYLIDDHVSETLVTTTPQQAFRAGLREGVKMSLDWGRQVQLTPQNFKQILGRQNRFRLKTWCEVGADVPNGYWAILGARLGLKLNVVDLFDYAQINSLDWIDRLMHEQILHPLNASDPQCIEGKPLIPLIQQLGQTIQAALGLRLELLTATESRDFKKNLVNPRREGLLREKQPQH